MALKPRAPPACILSTTIGATRQPHAVHFSCGGPGVPPHAGVRLLWSALPRAAGPSGCAPAQALVGGLLVQRHGVHELQARALVGAPQQRAAVAVDQPHPLQRAEEPLPNLLLLWFAVPVDRSTQM